MGLGAHARRHAQQHTRHDAVDPMQLVEAIKLFERIDDDAADTSLTGRSQLGNRLVVAMQHDTLGHLAGTLAVDGPQHRLQLAAARHVDVHAFGDRQARHRRAQERLGGVGRSPFECRDGLPATCAQVCLVIDEQRRAELCRQVDEIASPDAEASLIRHLSRIRQQPERDRPAGLIHVRNGAGGCRFGLFSVHDCILESPDPRRAHIASGASTPSRSRPIAKPMRVPSVRHNRASRTSGGLSLCRIGQSW